MRGGTVRVMSMMKGTREKNIKSAIISAFEAGTGEDQKGEPDPRSATRNEERHPLMTLKWARQGKGACLLWSTKYQPEWEEVERLTERLPAKLKPGSQAGDDELDRKLREKTEKKGTVSRKWLPVKRLGRGKKQLIGYKQEKGSVLFPEGGKGSPGTE